MIEIWRMDFDRREISADFGDSEFDASALGNCGSGNRANPGSLTCYFMRVRRSMCMCIY